MQTVEEATKRLEKFKKVKKGFKIAGLCCTIGGVVLLIVSIIWLTLSMSTLLELNNGSSTFTDAFVEAHLAEALSFIAAYGLVFLSANVLPVGVVFLILVPTLWNKKVRSSELALKQAKEKEAIEGVINE